MKIIFMATGDIALPAFDALFASEFELVGLLTQPDRPVGRKQVLTPPRIKQVAESHGIAVMQPTNVNNEHALKILKEWEADVFVVMAYGQILSEYLLAIPSLACVNLHASLLPRHRGASCIQAAILNGDRETGITMMHVSAGLDEGDMIVKKSIEIGTNETGGELHNRLADIGPEVLLDGLEKICKRTADRVPQDARLASYAPKLLRRHGLIDWHKSAEKIERLIRAYDPWPGTYTTYIDVKGRERRLKIYPPIEVVAESGSVGEILAVSEDRITVGCGENALLISMVQPDGGKQMNAHKMLASSGLKCGSKFGL